jgi:tetratricopeptide (TPR) repeat protein
MRNCSVLLLLLFAAACATAPVTPPRTDLFNDALFRAPAEKIDRADIFALSPEMKEYLRTDMAAQIRDKGLHPGFFEALYNQGQLRLDYDSVETRNAAQAFAVRSGNCLSLVIMSAAFAKALGLPVWFQSVNVDETWSRSGDIQFFIGHVNLTLGKKQSELGISHAAIENMTIDFLPPQLLRGLPVKSISENTIVAMYMNNKAAEAFARGKLDDAYWWARAAIGADPQFSSSYNTLGIVYRRHGNPDEALKVLAYANEREPANTRIMSNLVTVLNDTGHAAEASALSRKLDKLEPNPPFSYFNLGLKAMKEENYRLARDLFVKEVDRAPRYHEFHYWLAAAYAGLGDVEQAKAQLAIALEYSTTRKEHELYAAKLDRINGARGN